MSARLGEVERRTREFFCSFCGAKPGMPCIKRNGQETVHHAVRFCAATEAGRLPITDSRVTRSAS